MDWQTLIDSTLAWAGMTAFLAAYYLVFRWWMR